MPNQKASDVGDQLADPEDVSLIFRPIKIEQEGDLQNADCNDRQTDRHPRARRIKGNYGGEDPYKIGGAEREMREEHTFPEGEPAIALEPPQLYPTVAVCRHRRGIGRKEDDYPNRRRKPAKRDEEYENYRVKRKGR